MRSHPATEAPDGNAAGSGGHTTAETRSSGPRTGPPMRWRRHDCEERFSNLATAAVFSSPCPSTSNVSRSSSSFCDFNITTASRTLSLLNADMVAFGGSLAKLSLPVAYSSSRCSAPSKVMNSRGLMALPRLRIKLVHTIACLRPPPVGMNSPLRRPGSGRPLIRNQRLGRSVRGRSTASVDRRGQALRTFRTITESQSGVGASD